MGRYIAHQVSGIMNVLFDFEVIFADDQVVRRLPLAELTSAQPIPRATYFASETFSLDVESDSQERHTTWNLDSRTKSFS